MIFIFLILYICSFYWFKKTAWKRWLLWAVLIIFIGVAGSGTHDPEKQGEAMGRVVAVLLIFQAIRWAYLGPMMFFTRTAREAKSKREEKIVEEKPSPIKWDNIK